MTYFKIFNMRRMHSRVPQIQKKTQNLKHCVDLDNMCYSLSLISAKYVQKTAQSLCTLLLQLIRLLLFYGEKHAFHYIFRQMHSSDELVEYKIFYLNSDEYPKTIFILWKDICWNVIWLSALISLYFV